MTNLIDLLPVGWRPYARLARLDKPTGFMLLLYPAWWALALCAKQGGWPSVSKFIWFYIGAVIMRAAGCAINDVFDRNLDNQVERTKQRPVASGEIKPWQAVLFAVICCQIGLFIVMQLGVLTLWLSFAVLPFIVMYPLMKRITWWPQAFLGLVFNWGALMGYAAMRDDIPTEGYLLYAAGFFWTLTYDTIYAFQDIRDDETVGIKSTARMLGGSAKKVVSVWAGICFALLVVVGVMAKMGIVFYVGMALAGLYMAYTLKRWKMDDSASSLSAFQANTVFGDIVLAAMILGRVIVL